MLKYHKGISCRVSSSLDSIISTGRILIFVPNEGWKSRYLLVWLETTVNCMAIKNKE